ncbi:hypothetical protein HanIR_Chr17g0861941 [Helianthus annuus]|nr:hypothetical protein HanIR_Chr17g0861941 [Helianthus annuus]
MVGIFRPNLFCRKFWSEITRFLVVKQGMKMVMWLWCLRLRRERWRCLMVMFDGVGDGWSAVRIRLFRGWR